MLSDFPRWLFSQARTELGPFPDNWPFLREYAEALASGEDVVALKRRQIMISWTTAAFAHYVASRLPYHHGAIISAGQFYAQKQARRIVTVARNDGYDVSGTTRIAYPNGSEIAVFPSTEHAGVGESLMFAHMDEYDFHPYARENLATIVPALSNSGGQLIVTSTASPELGAAGPFAELWQDETRQAKRLFYGRWVRPDQGPEFIARERLRPGMSDDALRVYYPETPPDAFFSHSGLVYTLDKAKTLKASKVNWEQCKWRMVGIDPGGGDPTAIIPVGVTPIEDLHQYGEFYRRHADLEQIAAYLGKLGHLHGIAVGETGGTVLIETLQRMGFPAYKADMTRVDGIETVRWLLDNGRLTIGPDCTQSIAEFNGYHWAKRRDAELGGKYATSTPADNHADAMDARRYAVMAILSRLPASNGRVTVRWKR